ncbi:FAD-dependent monooxygenase [Pseudonocardia charpentierae]|uniref:FAD-dependent monooxygenase n=1 Tax=Pseudonocardia charpentierae TaxID=3075545 RepID=A0ABU2NHK9_9PSEU|nr:FAD-dependent monooxygenase [Pseudonocardia sp. DSM 45834]MDT0353448.1 FAD-dependent monooxygenase [Pseudonocardia sp. DSM 45834]
MRVVVVGAGPAGVATALLRARYGVGVVLVEREAMPGRLFRGEVLLPLGIDALHEMGVGRVLDEVPSRTIGSRDTWIDGERVLVVAEPVAEPVAQLGRRAVRVVSQPALLARLLDRATRYPGFAFHPEARLAELVRDGRGRVVGARLVRTGGGAAGWDERADLVLGCDGRGSSVRRHAGLALARSTEDYDVVWFTAPAPRGLAYRSGFLLCGRAGTHPAVGYVSWDGRLQYGVVMPKGRPWESGTGDWLADAVRAAPAFLAAHLLACRGEIEGPIRLTVQVGRCPAWTAPGVLLLDDAAHPMSPVRAQGINLALRDAVVAANHLVPALTGQLGVEAVDAACRAVQVEREPEMERAQRLQRRESRGQGHARSGSWRYTLARHGARLLGGHRWAETAWLRRQHDLRFGCRPVRLRLPPPP